MAITSIVEQLENSINILKNGTSNRDAVFSLLDKVLLAHEEDSHGCGLLLAIKNSDDDTRKKIKAICKAMQQDKFPDCLETTKLRAKTILWFENHRGNLQNPDSKNGLESLLKEYLNEYSDDVWKKTEELKKPDEPSEKIQTAAWDLLSTKNRDLAILVEQTISSTTCFQSPGVALLVDTLLELSGGTLDSNFTKPSSPNPWLPGQTWILIALQARRTDEPPGLLLRLRIEKIPNGCGAIYPHPRLAAHIRFDNSFAAGIRNAYAMTQIGETNLRLFDYRWWVTVVELDESSADFQSKKSDASLSTYLLRERIEGESATLAFALALKSAFKEEILRLDIVTSACFRDTRNQDEHYGWGDILKRATNKSPNPDVPLFPVGSFSSKDELVRLCQSAGVKIKEIAIAMDQSASSPTSTKTVQKTTFLDAYREFSEMERLLNDFAEERAGRWQSLVKLGRKSTDHGST